MSRRLIVCSDGTWQTEDAAAPSNVCRLADRVAAVGDDGKEQCVFYQPGVGTDPTRGALNRRLSAWIGGGFGVGLDRNILDIYEWLIHEYQDGDELWFFGFSRGAYTVRSTVGLLRNCGILKPPYARFASRAMDLYRARAPESHPDAPRSRSFRRNYSREIREVRFLGVWDTVGALGIPAWFGMPAVIANRRYRFHDAHLSHIVKHAFHALAIDEVRRTFTPALWRGDPDKPFGGTVEQVWFPGVHSDVGGGYPDRQLADLALRWMIERASSLGLGIVPADPPSEPDHRGPQHDSRWRPHRLPVVRSVATGSREIGTTAFQAIHYSAEDRLRDLAEYEPLNLKDALTRGVPVTARDAPFAKG